MARTGRRAASIAGRTLQDETATPEAKSLAASVLSQVEELPTFEDPVPGNIRNLERHARNAMGKRSGLIEVRVPLLLDLIQRYREALLAAQVADAGQNDD